MSKWRTALGGFIVAVVVAVLAPIALAWDATCNAGEMCNWRHANFGVPLAAKDRSDNDYTNDFYPNTQSTLNDSVSSIRNRFNTKDVVWFFDVGYSGTSFCLNPGWESGDLRGHNDQYSSHLVAVGSTC